MVNKINESKQIDQDTDKVNESKNKMVQTGFEKGNKKKTKKPVCICAFAKFKT